MASVDSGAVIMNRPYGVDKIKVKFRFILTDNDSTTHIRETGVKTLLNTADLAAEMLIEGPRLLEAEVEAELRAIIEECEQGGIPIHVDLGGFFEKAVPQWNIWDDAFVATAHHFFSLPDQISLAPYNATWSLVSSTDKRNALGITNQTVSDMNSDVQIAIDLQTQMDSYTPYFDADGNPI